MANVVNETRETWASRLDFLLSCVGCCVGFGNVWRFSYLCYKNGGGAFIIPYLCCVVVIGFPILFLEIAIGQFTRRGAVGIWDICPLMRGIGYSSLLLVSIGCVYYNIILAWVGYYFVLSFYPVLPWTRCDNDWNTANCSVGQAVNQSAEAPALSLLTSPQNQSSSQASQNLSTSSLDLNTTTSGPETHLVHASAEFWWREVLRLSEGIDTPGDVPIPLLISLAAFWVIVFFCVFRGVRWSGKVVYFTATFPYVLMLTLLVQAARQEGSGMGVAYYITPQFDRLADVKVWFDAACQVLFSYAVLVTVLPAYASFCPFNNNCFRDSVVVAAINSLTSFLAGFVIFAMLGHMAHSQQEPIENVATSGPGLAFIVYPQALSLLPLPQLWSVLFFFMMILVGLDSQFACVEGIMTCVWDVFPQWLKWRRIPILCVFIVTAFFLGICMVTEGGMYIFQLLDYYVFGAYIVQILACLEVITVAWIYGANRFYDDIELMIGYRINAWMKICWKCLTPALLMVILVFNLATYQPLTYNKTYKFPPWANGLGFLISVLVLIVVPASLLITLIRTPGNSILERLRKATKSKVDYSGLPLNCGETNTVEKQCEEFTACDV